MKTQFRFIEFVSHSAFPEVWVCRNKRDKGILGGVEWYPQWKQFTFSASESSVFSADCLRDIADFLDQTKKAKEASDA